MTQTAPKNISRETFSADSTSGGVYALSDAKRLLAALNFIVNEVFEDGDRHQAMLFGLIDAIRDKIDAASKMIEESK